MVASRRALLKISYRCNNNCVFCHSAPHRGEETSLQALKEKIRQARQLGVETLVLSGGEPTIHPALLELADTIVAEGMSLGLITNGRMLAYPALLDELIARRLDYVQLSLSGPDPDLHNHLVRAPAFEQVTKALTQLADRVPVLAVNVVVTTLNMDRLGTIAHWTARFPGTSLKLSLVEPEGNALSEFAQVVPPMKAAAKAIRAAIKQTLRREPQLAPVWDGLPRCLCQGLEDRESGLREEGFVYLSEVFEERWFPIDDRNRGFGWRCLGCSLRRCCRGVYRTYLERCGESELRPVSRPVSNSFNLEPSSRDEALSLKHCPIRSGSQPPPDPVRGLLVQTHPGRFRRHEVNTADFSDETLQHCLRENELVYRTSSRTLSVDDFARQLGRLRLASHCIRCSKRSVCGGVFVPRTQIGFKRAQTLLQKRLKALSGRVLDIGCGTVPYQAALDPAIRAGHLDYHGLDPQAGLRTKIQRGWRLHRGTLESFSWRGPRFDAILALRSLNHLTSPLAGLQKMASLLAPGGKLILAEDEVFCVVRQAAALHRVKQAIDLPFEHRVNLRADEAESLASEVGFRTQERLDPDQTDSTLWILMAEKIS